MKKRLLEICKNLDLRIVNVNGRANSDTLGRPTFHGKNRTSVIDYVMCDQYTLLNVNSFVVKQPSYLSDHRLKPKNLANVFWQRLTKNGSIVIVVQKDLSYEECQIKNIAIPLTLSYGRNFTKP